MTEEQSAPQMKEFTVYSATGSVLRTGLCNADVFEMQADQEAGERVAEGRVPFEPSPPVYGYSGNRRREYPPLQDLADAFYWAQKGNTGPLEQYIANCDAVKLKYPKGS